MATVTLTWGAPTLGSGGPVANYKIYRDSGPISDPATIISGGTLLSTVADTVYTYDDTSLNSGDGDHSYTVVASNTGGDSAGATPTTETL